MKSNNLTAAILGLLAFAFFSTHDVFVKQLGEIYHPVQIVFFASLLSFPFITIELIFEQKPGHLRPIHPWWVLLRSISVPTSAIAAFFAFTLLPLAEVYAYIFASPIIITLLAIPILGERIGLARFIAIAIGLAGVMVVLRPGGSEFGWGQIAALIAAFAGSLNAIIARKIGREERSVVMILYPLLGNLFVTAILLPYVYIPIEIIDLGKLALVGFLLVCAMGIMVLAYSAGDAVAVAPMQYSQMIWATVFGYYIFSEWPDQMTFLGSAIIALSGVLIVLRETLSTSSENQPVSKTRTRLGLAISLRVGNMIRRRRK